MKKSFILLSLLFLAGIAGMVFFWASLNRDKVDVRLNESVLYGDPREAENLSFTLQANLYGKVFWKTEHVLGEENRSETECTVDFFGNTSYGSDEEALGEQDDYFQLYWGYESVVVGSDEDYMDKFIRENNISGWYSETFQLKDEYAYYPLKIGLSLNDLKRDLDHQATEDHEKMIQQLEQKLASYFHMPIYDENLRIFIVANDEGEFTNCDMSTKNTLAETISSRCIVADQAIWFAFSKKYDVSEQRAKQYLSGLPKGAGVYRLPYQIKEGIPYFETDQLEQVYAVPSDTSLGDYVVDQNSHRILIHTEKDGKQSLTVLSSETGACVQEIPLESLSKDERVSLQYKEGVVLASSDEDRLIVLEKTEGDYSISLDVNAADEFFYCQDFAWNGDKLAMFAGDDLGVHYVYVYDRNGLLYKGKYRESLVLEETEEKPEVSFILYDNTHINLQWR